MGNFLIIGLSIVNPENPNKSIIENNPPGKLVNQEGDGVDVGHSLNVVGNTQVASLTATCTNIVDETDTTLSRGLVDTGNILEDHDHDHKADDHDTSIIGKV